MRRSPGSLGGTRYLGNVEEKAQKEVQSLKCLLSCLPQSLTKYLLGTYPKPGSRNKHRYLFLSSQPASQSH